MTAANLLVDEAARQAIRHDLDATLFVEAGAGSGKTSELVRRIVGLVATGRAPISGVVAITFTEAAAAELRIRIRQELEAAVAPGSLLGPEERRRCRRALDHLDEAPISTIHGFCQRILASHPIEAGLPPRFEVIDEVVQSLAWRERWSHELDLLGADSASRELVALGFALGVDDRRLERLARAVEDRWDRCRATSPDLESVLVEIDRFAAEAFAELRTRLKEAGGARSRCQDHDDLLFATLEEVAAFGHDLAVAGEWRDALTLVLVDPPAFKATRGKREAWGGDVDSVRELVKAARDARADFEQGLFDRVVPALTHHFEARAVAAAAVRRKEGRLGFHDLLVLARDLLRDDPEVRDEVRRRTARLLIDEFQDTDPLQLEIARLVGLDGGQPGKCFFVGDPKQSIYRFRGADLEAYESARDGIAAGVTRLSSNFRSVGGVIDFVNECFSRLLGERFSPLAPVRPAAVGAPGEAPSVPASPDSPSSASSASFPASPDSPSSPSSASSPGPAGGEATVVSIVGGALEAAPSRSEQRRIEAEDCCRVIERALVEGWPVTSTESGEGAASASASARPARLGDVTILVPRRTGLPELETALDAHAIAYRVESASLIFKSQEVRDLLSLARALGEPGDHAAVVATLRSPSYSIGDDELVAFARAGGSWSTDGHPDPAVATAAPRVAAALGDLARLRGQLGELGPAGGLSFAVTSRRLMVMAADRPHSREAWRRIRYLLERARAFEAAGGGGLAEFADWVEDQIASGARSSESVVPEADEDAVRIMTVHGAKGLEFPITILCGFGTSNELSAERDTLLWDAAGGNEAYFTAGKRTSGYDSLRAEAEGLERDEALRLLYVAATRARDHLVVCGHHLKGRNGPSSLGERLLTAASECPAAWTAIASSASAEEADQVDDDAREPGGGGALGRPEALATVHSCEPSGEAVAVPAAVVSTLEDYDDWCKARTVALARATRRLGVAATELSLLAREGPSALAGRPGSVPGDSGPVPGEPGDGADDLEPDDDLEPADELGAGLLPSGFGRERRARGRGRAGTQIGRAVHATLQSVSARDALVLGDRSARAEAFGRLEAIARAQARSERIEERAGEVARLARTALSSPTVRAAFTTGKARRELYVSSAVDGVFVDGFVDLCFEAGDGLVVVDYKTDAVRSPDEVAAVAEGYELQVAAYALALGDAAGAPVARAVLVFVSYPGEAVEHELSGEALSARIDEVRAALATMAG